MLIAIFSLVFLLFFGFGASDLEYKMIHIAKPAKASIQDKDRLDNVIRTGKQLGKDAKTLEKEVRAHYDELVAMHYAYGSENADYAAVSTLLKEDYRKLISMVLDARDEMKADMTPEEWSEIFTLDEE